MSGTGKNLLKTFERTNGGVAGHAVSVMKDGVEIILIAAERHQVEQAAQLAGLGEVNMDRVQGVIVLPRYSVLDEVEGRM